MCVWRAWDVGIHASHNCARAAQVARANIFIGPLKPPKKPKVYPGAHTASARSGLRCSLRYEWYSRLSD